MNFWVAESTCNWVYISNIFFTCIATWGQGNAYSDKEPDNMLLWTFWVFQLKLLKVIKVIMGSKMFSSASVMLLDLKYSIN